MTHRCYFRYPTCCTSHVGATLAAPPFRRIALKPTPPSIAAVAAYRSPLPDVLLPRAATTAPPPRTVPSDIMPKKKAAPAEEETTDKKTKTGPTPAEKLADELDDLMIAYLKACRETPDKAPALEKKLRAKTAQLEQLLLIRRKAKCLVLVDNRPDAARQSKDRH